MEAGPIVCLSLIKRKRLVDNFHCVAALPDRSRKTKKVQGNVGLRKTTELPLGIEASYKCDLHAWSSYSGSSARATVWNSASHRSSGSGRDRRGRVDEKCCQHSCQLRRPARRNDA